MIAARGETGRRNDAALNAADWLSLAAAPTFAVMAVLTGILGGGSDMACMASQNMSLLGGMIPMYLLMSAFHLAPWLRLVSRSKIARTPEPGDL